MWFQNLVPSMGKEVAEHGSEGLEALLEPVLLMVSECTRDEYQTHLLPLLRKMFPLTKSIHVSPDVRVQKTAMIHSFARRSPPPQSAQATALLLQNLEILVEKTARSDWHCDVLPLILNSFETNVPELQVRVFVASCHRLLQRVSPSNSCLRLVCALFDVGRALL